MSLRTRVTNRKEFSNWAGNQVCTPTDRKSPRNSQEVADLVARANRGRVKVVGAGHSFTDAACTDGTLLALDSLRHVFHVDATQHQITVGAGIRLFELNQVLADVGMAMPNLGDIAYQSLAGATSTATHGTGLQLGGLATTIIGMEIVTGTGEIIWCDTTTRPDLLRTARVGVGALGVVTKIKLQCVPAFRLHAKESVEPLDDLLDNFAAFASENDHAEFFWVPGARRASVKRNNRTEAPLDPPSRLSYYKDKILMENVGFGLICRAGRANPKLIPKVAKIVSGGAGAREFVDRSDKVFVSPRLVKFYEMEYGIPIEALPEAFRRVRDFTKQLGLPIVFPIECRVSKADDIPLSTASGRTSAWIAVHMYQGTEYESYFRGIEQIMNDYDGRPHWGKLHFQTADTLRPRYPDWDVFQSVRAELDPLGVFRNAYTDRVLGMTRDSTA